MSTRIAVGPNGGPAFAHDAVVAGGGTVVETDDATALMWLSPSDGDGLVAMLADAPGIEWVQTPFAGVEPLLHLMDDGRVWTCAKGVYAAPVAEHALTLALGGLRGLGTYARADSWRPPKGRNLMGAAVTILGGGGIAESFLRLIAGFGCRATVVRRSGAPFEGADRVVTPDRLADALIGADLVVLALALTPETEGIIGATELALMEPHSWLVNVARGRHIDTAALVEALEAGSIGGAGLDVTEPEPLPAGHPLWTDERCIITPHVGNTPEMAVPLLAARITENVRRYVAGEPLVGVVDPTLGY